MSRTHRLLLAIASAGALFLSAPAWAAQSSTSFQVTATVGAACTLSAPDLAFGTYTGTAVNGQTTISIDCGTSATFGTLTLTGSNTVSGFTDGFVMVRNGTFLNYDLFRDATHGQQILSGQGFSAGSTSAGTVLVDVFGVIPAGQTGSGSYVDTVSVVFDF